MKEHIGKRLLIVSNKMRRYLDSQYLAFGLSASQARLLRYLDCKKEDEAIFLTNVEKEFQIRGASAAELIDGLEKINLLTRVPLDSDRRKKKLVLTKLGKQKAQQSLSVILGFEEELSKALSPSEFTYIHNILDKIDLTLNRKEKEHDKDA